MTRISSHLLQQIGRHIAGLPAAAEDLAVAAGQLTVQLPGLERLDELDLTRIEPAVIVPPPSPEQRIHG